MQANNSENDNNDNNDKNNNNDKNDKNPSLLALYLPRFFFLEFVRNSANSQTAKLLSDKSKPAAAAVAAAEAAVR